MGKQKQQSKRKSKVIPLILNSSLYYNKAIEAAERNNFAKALRFFMRAVELEPDNPINHCNVAGMLAEMGRFEESNRILRNTLENIAPNLYECYFYMANNYAYLQQFEEAERNAIRYLHYAPDGVYAEDAEELLEHISFELGRPTLFKEDDSQFIKHDNNDRARQLLERGKFQEAANVLKETIRQFPDFLPARNNLALTYYYSGNIAEAIAEVQHVLEQDENNLHALCNLALFCKELGDEQRVHHMVEGLTKLYPMHSENVYKLATTLGILGEHEACYRLFHSLYKNHGMMIPSIVHQIAVAAYNKEDYTEATFWWQKLMTYDGEAQNIASFFLQQLQSKHRSELIPLSYRYPLHFPQPLEADHELLSILREILKLLRTHWKEEYTHFLPEAEKRLVYFTGQPLSRLQKVRKLEAIAAVVEYIVLSEVMGVSKTEIAERYHISVPTLNRYLEQYAIGIRK